MKCNHCGLCCKDPCTQINVTIGDLHRISKFLEVPVDELFEEKIGINPFADSNLIHYDLDLGLNLPCKFRVDGKCSIYPARPLNCRLFPYWILAEAPPEKLKDILSEHQCSYDMLRKKDYERYKDIIAKILLEESELLQINKRINVTRLKGFNEINDENFREKELSKINLIKARMNEKIPVYQINQIIEENKEKLIENNKQLEEAEKIK